MSGQPIFQYKPLEFSVILSMFVKILCALCKFQLMILEFFDKSKMATKMASTSKQATTVPINTPTEACNTSK